MLAHAQQRYSRNVHFRFVAAQDLLSQALYAADGPV